MNTLNRQYSPNIAHGPEILIEKAEKELQMTEEEMFKAQDEALETAMEWIDYNLEVLKQSNQVML